ncbi:MAG: cytochrome c family protein [Desulfobacterales bacterium]|nr:cytochrome c family protein [Desulfobacterales bacterium]
MKSKIFLSIIMLILLAPFSYSSEQNTGSENIVLEGGRMGKVSFPHHIHQNALGDCDRCHNLFPKTSKSIEKLKAEGKLGKKEIMNYCRDCHNTKAINKEKAGPTSCKACHQK